MTDLHTLVETERAMQSRVAALELDFEAAHAVSSIYRAANAVRGTSPTRCCVLSASAGPASW